MIKRKPATNREQFLAKMHEYLTDSKTKLLREMTAQLQIGRDASRDDGMDSGDLAFEENEREVSIVLSERERLRIGRIDDAIGRIASRKYGLCEACGFEVTEERLNAMPFARLCCDCQQEQEREAKTRQRHEGDDYKGYAVGSIPRAGRAKLEPVDQPRK
jgi:DnaK suppressor protein